MVVHSFPKNGQQEVRASLDEFRGQPRLSLWVFATSADGPKATKQGLSLSRDKLPELKAAVDALYEAEKLVAAG